MTHRATVAVAKDNGMTSRPTQTFSMTLNRYQVILAIIAHIIAMLGIGAGAANWVGKTVIQKEFQEQLRRFHETAQPQILSIIDAKIEHHHMDAMDGYHRDQDILRTELATLKEHARMTDSRLRRMEDMLWAVYTKELGTTQIPPRSPNGHH